MVCVDPARIRELWPHVEHFAKEAMRRGDLGDYHNVNRRVLAGQMLVWLAWHEPNIEAIAITELVRTERSRSCVIVACGGTRVRRWIGLIEHIENYARDEGCDNVRIFGRKGWQRLLKDYSAPKVLLEKAL
jgi:hypothetical protein